MYCMSEIKTFTGGFPLISLKVKQTPQRKIHYCTTDLSNKNLRGESFKLQDWMLKDSGLSHGIVHVVYILDFLKIECK